MGYLNLSRLAWRFITIRRSAGAVSAIASVSVVGIAIAVAAIICVLSVFNGFKDILTQRSDTMLADIEILPTRSKTLNSDSLLPVVRDIKGVSLATDVVSDKALAIYNSAEAPVTLYAADLNTLRRMTAIDSIIEQSGRFPSDIIGFEEAPEAIIAVGTAGKLGYYSSLDREESSEPIYLFTPKRVGAINPDNPMASFITDSVRVTGIYRSEDEKFDNNTIILSPEVVRPLFMYDDSQATSIIVKAQPGTDIGRLARTVSDNLKKLPNSDNLTVRTREQMQQTTYRMVNIEKWVTFLLLKFMLIIASFTIISTMTMFVLDKQHRI
ncbi:MAG: ABC transporter permease, partial [Muribaculaceae bacterium]|nr:ABC transporter permease [Muribaculaceae bacterium]